MSLTTQPYAAASFGGGGAVEAGVATGAYGIASYSASSYAGGTGGTSTTVPGLPVGLAGVAVGVATTVAALVIASFTGASHGVATTTGDATITHFVNLDGRTDGVATTSGNLGVAMVLAGSAHGLAATTATVTFTPEALTGRADGVATGVASLSVGNIQSSAHGVATTIADLTGTGAVLRSSVRGVAGTTATLGRTPEAFTATTHGVATTHATFTEPLPLGIAVAHGVAATTASLGGVHVGNDNFASAVDLVGTGGSLVVDTLGATLEAGEPDAAGRTDTVWYHFFAPGQGTLTIDTSATTPAWASVIDVFTGSALSNLVLVGTEPVTYTGVADYGDVWVRVSSTSDSRDNGQLTWSFALYPVAPPQPYVVVDPPSLTTTPTIVMVTLANLTPGETVSFTLDGTLLPDTLTVDDAGGLRATALHIPALADGPHTLTANTSIGGVATTLTVAAGGATVPTPIATPPSVVTQAGVVRWVFQDKQPAADPAQYVVPINPNEMTSPFGERAVTSEGTTAIDGQTIMWEGIKQPVQWQFSGVVLDQAHHDNLVLWSEKQNRIYIIDHYGRAWECYPQKLDITPVRAIDRPWKHKYTFTVLITRGPVAPV